MTGGQTISSKIDLCKGVMSFLDMGGENKIRREGTQALVGGLFGLLGFFGLRWKALNCSSLGLSICEWL